MMMLGKKRMSDKKTASDPMLDNLQSRIREIMHDRANHVDGGGCRDFAEYKHVTGVIEGLARAERELLDLDAQITES
jgi:hypothetical protein